MMKKCTPAAMAQVKKLRTAYPWAVSNANGVVIAVFNYRADAKEYARKDRTLTAFDASNVLWCEV
jgi:hypothetical protein